MQGSASSAPVPAGSSAEAGDGVKRLARALDRRWHAVGVGCVTRSACAQVRPNRGPARDPCVVRVRAVRPPGVIRPGERASA